MNAQHNNVSRFIRALVVGLLAATIADYLPNNGFGHIIHLGLIAVAVSTITASLEKSFVERKRRDNAPKPRPEGQV